MGTVYCKTLIKFDDRKHVWCKIDDYSAQVRENIGSSLLSVTNGDSLLKWIEAFMFCTDASETQRFFDEAFEYMRRDLTKIMSPQAFTYPDLIKSQYKWLSDKTYKTVVWCNQQTPRPIYYFDQEWFGQNLFADVDNYAELLKKLKIVFEEAQKKLKGLSSNNNAHVYYNNGPTIMQIQTFLNAVANVVLITKNNKKNNPRRAKRLENYYAWKKFVTEFISRRRAAESKRMVSFNKDLQNRLLNSMYFKSRCEYAKLLDRYDGNTSYFTTPVEECLIPETSFNDFLDYVLFTQYKPFICETQMCFSPKMWFGTNSDIGCIFRGQYMHCAHEDVQGGHFKFNNQTMFQRFVNTDELEIGMNWLLENTETDKNGVWQRNERAMFVQSSIDYNVLDFETIGFKTGLLFLTPINMSTNVNRPIKFYKILLMIFTYELTHHCNVLINKLHKAKQYDIDQIQASKDSSNWYVLDTLFRKKKMAGEYKYLENKEFDRYICLRIYAQLIKYVMQHITKHDTDFDCLDLGDVCDAILTTPNQPMNKRPNYYRNLEYSVVTATGEKYNFKIKDTNELLMYCNAKYEYYTIYWPTENERDSLLKCARRLCNKTQPDLMDETHLFNYDYFNTHISKNDEKQVDGNIKWSTRVIEELYICSSIPFQKNSNMEYLELILTVLGFTNYNYKVCNITCNAIC
ncbi:ORF121 peptide [Hyphantria cunea nucleopolyhedrovirus]|uniref:ORF121 peptide n=1 Tax=Hyphantria cunea nuclear polyhedrosis virus TaxID=28288 RepID=Q2NP35_NPVHC|nr:ORF121 peptide [Hyphantria cunea nucleopolyhedrovirus]BAE72410.1 ORF121 peptide [Hyphantria cunea nucleopolyhedrovirus]